MNKSSLAFLIIATLLIGGLIGLNLQPEQTASQPAVSANNVVETSDDSSLNYRLINPEDFPITYDDFGKAAPATSGENFTPANKAYKHDVLEIEIPLDGSVEYKAEMSQGDSYVYRWAVKDGEAYYDFHGHPTTPETEFFTRYKEGEGSEDTGSIVAAYKGQHGWFWLNISDAPITIELEVAGFYDEIVLVPVY